MEKYWWLLLLAIACAVNERQISALLKRLMGGKMKRILKNYFWYLPALVFTLWTLCLNVLTWRLIPLWHLWNGLFWVGGILLSRGKAWGCMFGLAPAVMVLGLNWREPGGLAFLMGFVWLIFYGICGRLVWKQYHE